MATPLLPLLLAAAMLSCATLTLSNPQCPPCGSTHVPYPLSTHPTCGDTRYNNIRCHNNATLFFDSVNNTYPITSISQSDSRLVIAPSNFTPNTCVAADLPTNGLQLSDTGPFNITGSNTIFFLNCTDLIHLSPLNCTDRNPCHVYADAGADGAGACRNTTCCWFKAGGSVTAHRIRLGPERCRAYRSFVNPDPNKPVAEWPKPGVELEWVDPRAAGTEELHKD